MTNIHLFVSLLLATTISHAGKSFPTCYNPCSPPPPPPLPQKRNLRNIVQSVYTWRHGGHVSVPNQSSGSWTLSFAPIILHWYYPCEQKGFIIDHSRPKRNWRQCLCCMTGNAGRQRGRVASASDSQSGGPGFESRSGHLLDLCSVVPSSNSRPCL